MVIYESKTWEGVYPDARIGRTERHNLMYLVDSDELLRFYLQCVRDGVHVDINDFVIEDQHTGFKGRMPVKMKPVIWKLLKILEGSGNELLIQREGNHLELIVIICLKAWHEGTFVQRLPIELPQLFFTP